MNLKKLLIPNLPYAVIGLYATKLSEAWRLTPGVDFSEKLLNIGNGFAQAFAVPLPSFHPTDLCIGLMLRSGSAAGGVPERQKCQEISPWHGVWLCPLGYAEGYRTVMIDPVFAEQCDSDPDGAADDVGSRPKNPANARNKNVLVVGGSGSGKTRFWLKPNLLQCHSSYVVTDPKGDIVIDCGQALLKQRIQYPDFQYHQFQKVDAL